MKKIILVILSLLMCISLVACSKPAPVVAPAPAAPAPTASTPATPPVSTEMPTIGVLIFDYTNAYVSYIRNSIETAAEGKATILMVDGQNDQTKQSEQVDTLLQKGVDAIAVNVVQVQAAATMIEKVRAAGIPVIFFNRSPTKEEIMGYEDCYYVGMDPKVPGVMQADMVMDFYNEHKELDKNGDGIMQYVILEGTAGHPDAKSRTDSVMQTFDAEGFKVELLDKQPGDFQTPKAKDIMDTWIGKYGDKIEMVVSNNDAMLLGAVEALRGAGYLDGVMDVGCVGINALPEVLPMIDDGIIIGSILSNPVGEGQAIFQIAYNCINGDDPFKDVVGDRGEIKDIRVPFRPIDKSNTDVAREVYKK